MEQYQPNQDNQALWEVTNISDTTTFSPESGPVPSKKITFKTATGQISTLTVPDSEFDAANVSGQIHEMASKMIRILTLKGPSLNSPPTPAPFTPYMPDHSENG